MLAGQVNDDEGLDFPVEQNIELPKTWPHWEMYGNQWIARRRKYSSRGSIVPLTKRMRTTVTCENCHSAPVLQLDRYEGGIAPIGQRLCSNCAGVFLRAGYSSYYQNQIDDVPVPWAGMAHYQDKRRSEPSGEQRLAAALIASAAADVWRETTITGGDYDRAQAMRWLRGEQKGQLSFLFCCEALDVDPEYICELIFSLDCADRYSNGYDSKRSAKQMHHPAVDEHVPDPEGSQRSAPPVTKDERLRRRILKARERIAAQAAIAAYTS